MSGKSRRLGAAIFLCLASVATAHGKDSAGSTVGSTLLRGEIGARSAALGGAMVAGATGATALRYNPAILADASRRSLFLQYDASILDINRSDLIYATPWKDAGLAIGASYIDYGTITRTTISNPGGAGSLNPNDLLLRVGYGRAVNDRFDVGGSLAYYRLDLDNVAAGGVTADLGLRAKTSWDGLVLGAAVRNVGSRARFIREAEELPLSATVGFSWRAAERLAIMTDLEWIRGLNGAVKAGIEFNATRQISLRAGYNSRNDAGSGFTLGAGFALSDLELDYAFVPFGDLGNEHRVSAEWSFGEPKLRTADRAGREAATVATEARHGRRKTPSDVAPATINTTADREARATAAPARSRSEEPTAAAPPAQDPDAGRSIDDLLVMARKADDDGDKLDAARYYRKVLAREPEHQVALYNIATLYYQRREYADAARYYRALTMVAPQDVEAWLFLAISQDRTGRRDDALLSYRRALELDPDNAYARQAVDRGRG